MSISRYIPQPSTKKSKKESGGSWALDPSNLRATVLGNLEAVLQVPARVTAPKPSSFSRLSCSSQPMSP